MLNCNIISPEDSEIRQRLAGVAERAQTWGALLNFDLYEALSVALAFAHMCILGS